MGPSPAHQPSGVILASSRWYSSAQLAHHQHHTMPQLQLHTMPQLQLLIMPQKNTHLPHTLSNTELLMTTPRLTSMPKKPLMARQPPDLTKSTFPMAVYKL